jgi:hypothetical protein
MKELELNEDVIFKNFTRMSRTNYVTYNPQ